MKEISKDLTEQAKKEWEDPTVLCTKGKKCECSDSYTYDSTPSYGMVCDASGYIKECDDC